MKTSHNSENLASLSNLVRILLFLLLALASQPIWAQGRLSAEFRPSTNFPTSDFGNVKVGQGGGFEAVGSYRFMPHMSAYVGWGWNIFGIADSFAGPNSSFEETGYTYGLQFMHPLKGSELSLMLRGGGLSNHIEVENSDGDIVADSGHGFGWQVEGGLAIPISKKWHLLPSLRYRSLSQNINIGSAETSGSLKYLSLGLGVCWQF